MFNHYLSLLHFCCNSDNQP